MILAHLLRRYRQRSDDNKSPPLICDEDATHFFNEAVDEACVRGRLLFDEASTICNLPIVPGQNVYALDPSIYEIVDMWYVDVNNPNSGRQLYQTSQSAMDSGDMGGWSNCRSHYTARNSSFPYWTGFNWRVWTGSPWYYIQDQARIQLVPIPTTASTQQPKVLKIACYRRPMDVERMTSLQDEPVIPEHWHESLVDWALYRAYLTKDSEVEDATRADQAYARFERSFGKRMDANVIRKQAEGRRNTCRSTF